MLSRGRKIRGYARYSPLFFFLFVLPNRPLQSTLEPWSPGAGDPRCRPPQHEDPRCLLRRRVPHRPGVVWRFPGRRPRLFDMLLFVLAFLRQIMYTLCLYSDTIASANLVLSSCCIRALMAPG